MDYYDLAATKTFLVSQKALIIEDQRFLLLLDAHRRKWELPGGLLEMDETVIVAGPTQPCRAVVRKPANTSLRWGKKKLR